MMFRLQQHENFHASIPHLCPMAVMKAHTIRRQRTVSSAVALQMYATQYIYTAIYFIFLTLRLRLKCDGTRAETRFRLSARRTSPFKSPGASVQSTTEAVHISLQSLYCSCKPVFCSHVTLTGYTLHSLVSPSLLHPCVTVCHHISTGLYH